MELTFIILLGILLLLFLVVRQREEIKLLRNGLSQLFDQLAQIKKTLEESTTEGRDPQKRATTIKTVEEYSPVFEDQLLPHEIESKTVEDQEADQEILSDTGTPPPLPIDIQPNIAKTGVSSSPTTVQPKSDQERESWLARFKRDNPDIEKFIGENLINKIGIIILVLGISFFVKYAIDKDWINEPARVGIGILCGGILLGVAHRLRSTYKAFSSVLVAGATAVFYFTIGIGFHDYQLFSQTTAFIIMVAITVFCVFVSLLYDRQELAVLSVIGGFAVPFMVSTGEGNYHVLFTYLAVLNTGMLTISFYKRWFIVNFVAFILTVFVFAAWYFDTRDTTHNVLRNALIYASLFYAIFSLAFVLNNIVRKNRFTNYEIIALITNTAVYYAVGYHIFFIIFPQQLGLYTICLAIFNITFAFIIYRKYQFDKNIVYVLIGLALTLATITIPVQFNGNYITVFWACEAVLLFWLTTKSKLSGFTFVGIIVQWLAVISLVMDLTVYFDYGVPHLTFANRVFLTSVVLIGSLILSYRLFKKNDYSYTFLGFNFNQITYRKFIAGTAIILGYILPLIEITYQASYFFSNTGTILIFLYLFHMLYCTAFVIFSTKNMPDNVRWSNFICVFNLLFYMLLAYNIPLLERRDMIYSTVFTFPYALALHYLSALCLLYQFWYFARNKAVNKKLNLFKKQYIPWFLAFFIVYFLSTEVNIAFLSAEQDIAGYYTTHNFVIKVVFPILWGILAFAFLIFGIRRNIKTARIIALTILGLTIVKLFVYDIRDVSETGKIIAFILLGILILVISFVYQKIKKLIVEDHEKII